MGSISPVCETTVGLLVLDSSSAKESKKLLELEMSKTENNRDVKI